MPLVTSENFMQRTHTSMKLNRLRALGSRMVLGLSALALAPLLSGCPKGDVGAACNHGRIEPPESKLVTFPALACNDLLCVYADEEQAPETACTVGPQGDAQCNMTDPSKDRFSCVVDSAESGTAGHCELNNTYVLQRSMCSKKCSSDEDCQDGGITSQIVADETSCSQGFKCVRIQTLGEFCCEKLCVCEDDLGIGVEDIQQACAASMQDGCCDQTPVPAACGKP